LVSFVQRKIRHRWKKVVEQINRTSHQSFSEPIYVFGYRESGNYALGLHTSNICIYHAG